MSAVRARQDPPPTQVKANRMFAFFVVLLER
jgi:hypothetical protein